jgi:hypothetical protein
MFRLREIGVATQHDFAEPRTQTQKQAPIDFSSGVFVRGPVPRAIDKAQHFGGVGQRYDQGMIAPGPVIGNVHALLALTGGLGQGAVHVEERTVEEGVGLPGPDPQTDFVDGVDECFDTLRREAAAKVACGGRIG